MGRYTVGVYPGGHMIEKQPLLSDHRVRNMHDTILNTQHQTSIHHRKEKKITNSTHASCHSVGSRKEINKERNRMTTSKKNGKG